MMDRLDKAWSLRRDVHAWVKANPDCGMRAIGAAFGGHPYDTIRRVVSKLNRRGFLMLCARSQMSTYRAVGDGVDGRDDARNVLRSTGRRMGPANGRKAAARRERNAKGRFIASVDATQDDDAWRHYVHRSSDRPAIHNQRGQGAAA